MESCKYETETYEVKTDQEIALCLLIYSFNKLTN